MLPEASFREYGMILVFVSVYTWNAYKWCLELRPSGYSKVRLHFHSFTYLTDLKTGLNSRLGIRYPLSPQFNQVMSSQRRLAIVPGSDMLSPKEAQRILSEHEFSNCFNSHYDHPWHGSSPRRSGRTYGQNSQPNYGLCLPGEKAHADDYEFYMLRAARKASAHVLDSARDGRTDWRHESTEGRLNLDTRGCSHQENHLDDHSKDSQRRYMTSSWEDPSFKNKNGSDFFKPSHHRDIFYPLGSNNLLSKVRN